MVLKEKFSILAGFGPKLSFLGSVVVQCNGAVEKLWNHYWDRFDNECLSAKISSSVRYLCVHRRGRAVREGVPRSRCFTYVTDCESVTGTT